jgi:hypothetical protein
MQSAIYQDWLDAIRSKRRVAYAYKGERREGCPHVLGLDKDGIEKVLVYRIIPGSRLPGEWRCLFLSKTAGLKPVSGEWLEGDSHTVRNSCIVEVHIDVNRAAEQLFDWNRMEMRRRTKRTKMAGDGKSGPTKRKPRQISPLRAR